MAAAKVRSDANKPGKKALRGRMPVKRSINLVLINENKINLMKAIPSALLIVALAFAFSKFLVVDRLNSMSVAAQKVSVLQREVDALTDSIQSYGNVEEVYAHLTYDGMTKEELGLVDRTLILEMLGAQLPAEDVSSAWNVSGNVLTVEVTGSSLDMLNELARQLETEPIVDSCTINTAKKSEKQELDDVVHARFIIYLKQPEGEANS